MTTATTYTAIEKATIVEGIRSQFIKYLGVKRDALDSINDGKCVSREVEYAFNFIGCWENVLDDVHAATIANFVSEYYSRLHLDTIRWIFVQSFNCADIGCNEMKDNLLENFTYNDNMYELKKKEEEDQRQIEEMRKKNANILRDYISHFDRDDEWM